MQSIALIILTDSLYLPGTIRLLESFYQHNGRLPAIAISRDPEPLTDPKLTALTTEQRLIDTSAYADIRPYKKSRSLRHAETFYKFEAFRNFGYERNLFLDSDLLCLRPTPLLVSPSEHSLLAALDTGFRPTRGYKGHSSEINTGVLSIHRSLQGEETLKDLQQIARDRPGRSGYNSGDQGIINKWIRQNSVDLGILPSDYNLIKKDYADTTGLETCCLLHYCDRKPWIKTSKCPSSLETLWFNK